MYIYIYNVMLLVPVILHLIPTSNHLQKPAKIPAIFNFSSLLSRWDQNQCNSQHFQ